MDIHSKIKENVLLQDLCDISDMVTEKLHYFISRISYSQPEKEFVKMKFREGIRRKIKKLPSVSNPFTKK